MRTETLAIVFTDIKGYTAATSAQTHQENAAMLRRTQRLIEPVVRAFDGRVVKSIGDAYMLVFRSPTVAVRCAAAVQDRIHAHNQQQPSATAVHIRIAINVGEVRVHQGDIFGEPVNIAARLESVTPADDIYLSRATYLTMNRSDLPCDLVGDYELKGLPEPVTVYRLRKYAQPMATGDTGASQNQAQAQAGAPAANRPPNSLPYGGSQLPHLRRMQWLRRAYLSIWILGLSGMLGAAYLRYRPAQDYTHLLRAAKAALEQNQPINAIAATGQIPLDALEELSVARRYRRDAVLQLLGTNRLDPAEQEIKQLLKEERRDAETLMLRGLLLGKRGNDPRGMLEAFQEALKLQPQLAENPDVTSAVIQGYAQPSLVRTADMLVDQYLRQRATPALQHALGEPEFDRLARRTIALRLEKLGAGESVDWVALALDDLHSTSCNARRTAIVRLVGEGDERAVGPLLRLGEGQSCGAKEAKLAARQILEK